MDTEQTTAQPRLGQERPPSLGLGSDEAIGEIVEAILAFGRDDPDGLCKTKASGFPFRLRYGGYLGFEPHYLEVVEALRDLGWVHVVRWSNILPEAADVRTTPEDMLEEYVARVRRREMEQRRELAARRRRDAEKLGLSAEESDRTQERRDELMHELFLLTSPFLAAPPPPPADWQPDEAILAEGRRRWLRYIDRQIRYHHQRPDTHPKLRGHDGQKMMREYAWNAECERREAKIQEELRALGCEDTGY